jgi:hypothetical protein
MTSPQKKDFYQRFSVGIMAILVFLLPMVVVGRSRPRGTTATT